MTERRLLRRLTLEEPAKAADGAGGNDETWVALGTLWAEVKPSTGREVVAGARERVSVTHRIIVRGAPVGAPSRPTPVQRFREGSRLFGIRAVTEADPDARYLICWAEEGIAS